MNTDIDSDLFKDWHHSQINMQGIIRGVENLTYFLEINVRMKCFGEMVLFFGIMTKIIMEYRNMGGYI